jgi:hypothetical protein
MRSLFAKILLWFLATIMVAFIGFSVIAMVNYNDPMRMPPMARAFVFQAREASEAYEEGGVAALGPCPREGDFPSGRYAYRYARPRSCHR